MMDISSAGINDMYLTSSNAIITLSNPNNSINVFLEKFIVISMFLKNILKLISAKLLRGYLECGLF